MAENKQTAYFFKALVEVPSDTGTKKEQDVEEKINALLAEMSYFKIHSNQYGKYTLKDDYLKRSIVWGLVKGESSKTFVMMHHHDTVDISEYGNLKGAAYCSDELKHQLKQLDLSEEVQQDLLDENWIFGRGTADMKAGAAVQLTVLENYSKEEEKPYNLLLISVPDEENMSIGMRQAANLLKQLKDQYALNYQMLINSEPHERREKACGTIYTGSVGKMMPVIYVRGKSSHIGNVYEGVNPVLIVEHIGCKIEMNPIFCDTFKGEATLPPAMMQLRDRKKEYNVSTPAGVGLYFSLLLFKRPINQLMNQLTEMIKAGCKEAAEQIKQSYKAYSKLAGKEEAELNLKIKIVTFKELYHLALGKNKVYEAEYKAYVLALKKQIEAGEVNLPESTFLMIEKLLSYIPSKEPMVITAFAPPYYPSIQSEHNELVQKISLFAQKEFNECYREQYYFMGISDMSYVTSESSAEEVQCLSENMPQWETLYSIPFETMREIAMPAVNIGPWGKDLHQITERVYKKDVYEQTQKLIEYAIKLMWYTKCNYSF